MKFSITFKTVYFCVSSFRCLQRSQDANFTKFSITFKQGCGSESVSESKRIQNFWLDPNLNKNTDSDTDSDSDPGAAF
jgi:hypothetical protein